MVLVLVDDGDSLDLYDDEGGGDDAGAAGVGAGAAIVVGCGVVAAPRSASLILLDSAVTCSDVSLVIVPVGSG